ncbi:MAG TPA: FHA domain-containing protein [Pyrinomonadaceae bacterium]|nr:FHA domain-containing protein [Pyrinomonadaceae bacterium]
MQGEKDLNPKPYLEGLVGQLAGKQFFLENRRVVVGRDPSQCQITLAQNVISKIHAALEVDDLQRATLVDLSGRQSTFVNGEPITRRELKDGDRVGFGLGGVVAFTYRAAFPALKYRNVPTDNGDHNVARLIISTEPQAPREHARPAAASDVSVLPPQSPKGTAGTTIMRAAKLPVIRLGRAPDNNFVLDAPSVSRYHAILNYENGSQPIISDLGSTNGTFVNGQLLTEPRQLTPEDLVFLGGFLLHVDGRTIKQHDLSASSVTAQHITKTIEGNTILHNISLAIKPREFIGLMGPSGCGKSTLMDALNGLRPATTGHIYINDLDLYQNFNALRRSIGYVPQRDILHDALTVERTLFYAAKLRLPQGTTPEVVQNIINEVIQTVGLVEQRHTTFRQLSGGQQKRLSLALELITKPSFLFLDEPTSPLDPETTENMMMLFRRLADEGRIVVMVTHKFEKFRQMHQIAMLTKGGRLAFYGPPAEALQYFGCQEPGDIYRHIGSRDPDQLSRDFEKSAQHQKYVHSRILESESLTRTAEALQLGTHKHDAPERGIGLRQWSTLTRRYLEVKLKDKRNTLLLLAQAPIVAILLAIIVGDSVNNSQTLFIAAIVSIWFGANNAVREIVSEAAIYSRERLVNLKIPSYVFSKFTVLSGIALIQCVLFTGILVGMKRLDGRDFPSLTLVLYLTSVAGIATGLFFSALVNSTEKAMSVLPLLLIPQLLLSGYLKPLNDVYVFAQTQKPASHAQFLNYEANKDQKQPTARPTSQPALAPVGKRDGLGVANYAAYLMVARWTIEGLAHIVSVHDSDARSKLAATIYVAEYERVFEGKSEDEIATAYRRRVAVDCAALVIFNFIFLALTMWALKRKDVL